MLRHLSQPTETVLTFARAAAAARETGVPALGEVAALSPRKIALHWCLAGHHVGGTVALAAWWCAACAIPRAGRTGIRVYSPSRIKGAPSAAATVVQVVDSVAIVVALALVNFAGAQTHRNTAAGKVRRSVERGLGCAVMSDLGANAGGNTGRRRGRPAGLVATDNFHGSTHLRSTLLGSQARVFILRAVAPDGGLLSPHQGNIAGGGLASGGSAGRRTAQVRVAAGVASAGAGAGRRGRCGGIGEGAAGLIGAVLGHGGLVLRRVVGEVGTWRLRHLRENGA